MSRHKASAFSNADPARHSGLQSLPVDINKRTDYRDHRLTDAVDAAASDSSGEMFHIQPFTRGVVCGPSKRLL